MAESDEFAGDAAETPCRVVGGHLERVDTPATYASMMTA